MPRNVTLRSTTVIPADAGKAPTPVLEMKDTPMPENNDTAPPVDVTPDAPPPSNAPADATPFMLDQIHDMGVKAIKELHELDTKSDMTAQRLAWLIMMRHVDMVNNDIKPEPWNVVYPRASDNVGAGSGWSSYRRDTMQFFLGDRVTDGGQQRTAETIKAAAAYLADEQFIDRALQLASNLVYLGVAWTAFDVTEDRFSVSRDILLEAGDQYLDTKDGRVDDALVPEVLPLDNRQYSIRTGFGTFPAIRASMARISIVAKSRRDPLTTPAARRAARMKVGNNSNAGSTPAPKTTTPAATPDATPAPANGATPAPADAQPGDALGGGLAFTFYRDQVEKLLGDVTKLFAVQSVAESNLDDYTINGKNSIEDVRRFLNGMITRTKEAREEKAKAELIAKREVAAAARKGKPANKPDAAAA